MSVSHCMGHALTIAAKPRAQWRDAILALPAGCDHSDCGQPRNCRQRITEYLRMQSRAQDRRRGK